MKSNKFKFYGIRYKLVVLVVVLMIMFIPNLMSQNISTIREIYNYKIGDIFHFDFFGNGPGYGESSITNIMITDLYYSQNNDTIFYIRKVDRKINSFEYPETVYKHYIDTIFYTNLDSLVKNGQIDSVYSDTNLYYGRKINYYNNSGFEQDSWSVMHVDGCGEARIIYSNWDTSVSSDDKLIYYKKGDEEWGVPHPVSVNEVYTGLMTLNVYPIPSKNYVNIFSENLAHGSLSVVSLTGEIVMAQNIKSNLTTIDISKLSSGIYLLIIETGKQKLFRKLVKN